MTDGPPLTKNLLAALDCIRDAIPGQPLTLTAGQVFQIMMLLPPAPEPTVEAPNTLTNLLPDLYAAADTVGREKIKGA